MSYFTIDVRLHPNQQQEILLLMTLSSSRLIFQWAKHVRDCYYARTQQYLPTTQLMVKLFRLKQRKSFLKKVNAQALQQVLWDLDSATQRYLQGLSGPPQFSNPGTCGCFRVPQHALLTVGPSGQCTKLYLPKIGQIKVQACSTTTELYAGEDIHSVTVSLAPNGQWSAAILLDKD